MRTKVSFLLFLIFLVLGSFPACSKRSIDDKQGSGAGHIKPVQKEKLNLKTAEAFGDFIFMIPEGWSRAPLEMEREEKSYLFGNETINKGSEPSILMIRQVPAHYPNAAALEQSLALIKEKWSAAHPQAVPETMKISGMETLRLRDELGKKTAGGPTTLFALYAKHKNTLYSFVLLVPGSNAPWPDYADGLLGRLYLREKMERKRPTGRAFPQRLEEGVTSFREGLRLNSIKAIQKYASSKTFERFYQIEGFLWPVVSAQKGWREFAEQAVVSFGKLTTDQAVVLLFDPWTDMAFLTLWTDQGDGSVKMTDVEMLLGSSLREPAKKSLIAEPAWYRQEAYAPFALGWHTTATVEAFQNIFGEQKTPPGQFRTALPALSDPTFLTANYVAAALSRSWLRSTLTEFFHENAPTPEYRSMTALVEAVKTHAPDQMVQKLSGSSADLLKALARLGPDDLNSLKPAAFVAGKKKSVLLLSHAENPDLVLSIRFVRKGDEALIDRLDLVSLNAFYVSRKEFGR